MTRMTRASHWQDAHYHDCPVTHFKFRVRPGPVGTRKAWTRDSPSPTMTRDSESDCSLAGPARARRLGSESWWLAGRDRDSAHAGSRAAGRRRRVKLESRRRPGLGLSLQQCIPGRQPDPGLTRRIARPGPGLGPGIRRRSPGRHCDGFRVTRPPGPGPRCY